MSPGSPDVEDRQNAPDFVIRARIDRAAAVTASELRNPGQARLDPQSRALVQSALEAFASCSPLRLPAGKYEAWREMVLSFDPSAMFER